VHFAITVGLIKVAFH